MWSRQRAVRIVVVGVLATSGNAAAGARAGAYGAPLPAAAASSTPAASAPGSIAALRGSPRAAPARPTAAPKVSVSRKKTRARRSRRSSVPQPPHTAVSAAPSTCEATVAAIAWPPTWQVRCAGPRPGILGLTDPAGDTTTLYVRPEESPSRVRVVALHEAGHAWDIARLDHGKVARWCAARGCDAAHFFSGGAHGPGWYEPGGAEDWAASWDSCHGGEYHRSYLGLPPPTAAECALQNTLTGYARESA